MVSAMRGYFAAQYRSMHTGTHRLAVFHEPEDVELFLSQAAAIDAGEMETFQMDVICDDVEIDFRNPPSKHHFLPLTIVNMQDENAVAPDFYF